MGTASVTKTAEPKKMKELIGLRGCRLFGWVVVLGVLVLGGGCVSREERTNVSATQPVRSNTPAPLPAEPVRTPANVSFSTWSKEWPIAWQWIDPDEDTARTPHDVKKGVLRIRVPNGKDLSETRQNAPRYMKSLSGDFQIETRLRFSPAENYQGAGLLVYADPTTYMRFERAYGRPGGGAGGFRIDVRTLEEGQRTVVAPVDAPFDGDEVELRVVRSGNSLTELYRTGEDGEWRELATQTIVLPASIMAGVAVCNSAREITAEFQYIKLLPVT
jgi:regulation of enolase protein 1 (concanavalin A-like superfamily)